MQNKAEEQNPLPSSSAPLLSFWALPFTMARMIHDLEIDGMHAWARSVWGNSHPHHQHERSNQLEIPDAIAEAPEQDLFA
jgi:hypothetical protein